MGFLLDSDIAEIAKNLGQTAHAFAGKRIYITGARGFLGRYFGEVFLYLNRNVLSSPCEIVALDNHITSGEQGSSIPKDSQYHFIQHDVVKPFYPEKKVDYVIHAAGIASPYYYRKYPLETLKVATIGLENTLEIASKHGSRIIFFSSSEIYGDPDSKHVPTRESYRGNVNCQGPRACYDESKRLGETLMYIYHQTKGVHGMTIRPFNVSGPGMQKTDYRVLPNFAAKILEDKPIQIYGTGNQTRTFCYITDAIVGFLKVLVDGVAGEPYNIGNPTPEISMSQLADSIEKILGRPIKRNIVEYPDSYPTDEPNRRCPDITKAIEQVGYSPTVSLHDGLKRFLDWASANYV